MRKLGTWLAPLLITSTVLAGCASGNPTPSANGQPESASATGKQEITFAAYSNYEKPLTEAINAFEEQNPEIKVKLDLAPFDQLMETIEIKLSAKSKDVDALFVDSPLVMNYSVKGYLAPLDELIDGDAKQKWTPAAVESVTYNSQLVAAPMNSSSQVLYYNKELFAKNGIPLPDENTRMTWEEVVELAKKLTGDNVYGFSFEQISKAYQMLALSDSLGVKMISEDGLTATGYSNSPEAAQAFQFYGDLFNQDQVSPKIKKEESLDYFTSGKVAMYLATNQNMPKIRDSGMDFGVTLHPYFAGKQIATPTGAWNLGVSQFSEKKEAAAKLVEFLTLGEGAQIIFEVGGTLPPQVELLDAIATDPKYEAFPDSILRIAAKESLETAVSRPMTPGYLEWESNMNKAFDDIKNGAEPQKALDQAVSIIDNQLKKYKDVAAK
ncbi:sugar ABC transporter substrate-binding protein [Paenibacillus senegalimassiliensis]|uniref:sugar ABC transporter substrate-binding protein n=1 Tax=Paenibacillus senegalimassiliensis TaxID=1737426 RepID=UPI000B77859A|nr:sugar ABC transporter substrate-binding protein [Paenibacillus senegalimassiliensis]